MRKIAKIDANYACVLQKIAELIEKNSQEPLILMVINILVNKKWYSQRKDYFSKKDIAIEVISSSIEAIDKYKIDDLEEILHWLLEKGWIEEKDPTDKVLSSYAVSELGNSLIKFLLESQALLDPRQGKTPFLFTR